MSLSSQNIKNIKEQGKTRSKSKSFVKIKNKHYPHLSKGENEYMGLKELLKFVMLKQEH